MLRWGVVAMLIFGLTAPAFFAQRERTAVERNQAKNNSEQREFTIATTSRLVLLDVSVKDSKGGFVSGLARDNFKVYENGKQQEISQFANADIPVTVGIVVDESGSMRPKRPEVVTAALAFISASNPKDEEFVINFNDRVSRGLPEGLLFSDNIAQLREALRRTAPEGRTALYDAIIMALQQLEQGRQDKKTLILISDGGDNASVHTLGETMDAVLKSAATIYTIGIFDEDDTDRNPGVLKKLAHVSGGDVYFPRSLEGMVPACRQIAQDIRTRYTIGYVPSASNGNKLRHIRVVVSSPDRAHLIARTRTSYIFPETAQDSGQ
jgi:Ca-activated chloride channel homolog